MTSAADNLTAPQPPGLAELSAAFLTLRERSRTLLRERGDQLHRLEVRLQDELDQLASVVQQDRAAPASNGRADEQIAALQIQVRDLQRLRTESEEALDEARVMLAEMEHEHRALRSRLDEASLRTPPAAATPPVADQSEEVDRLQRRLEMAMQEIRELKELNSELEQRPAAAATAPRPADVEIQLFDWESQKLRLLQQLAADYDTAQPQQAKEKLRIEEVIRRTDQLLAEKDRRIAELEERCDRVPSAPPPRDEVTHAVDVDDAVRSERERLRALQEEWQEKLRKSEVEISIERAKLARERMQWEERLRNLEAASPPTVGNGPPSMEKNAGPAAARGRWLTRLGLNPNDPT